MDDLFRVLLVSRMTNKLHVTRLIFFNRITAEAMLSTLTSNLFAFLSSRFCLHCGIADVGQLGKQTKRKKKKIRRTH